MKRLLSLVVLFALVGCASVKPCPPCVPEIEIVESKVPVYECPAPAVLPELALPPWPILGDTPTEEELKEWYIKVEETYRVRFAILIDYIKALQTQLDGYR